MADAIDLLGLVGTWLAAILALVALAGIIPAYILYRESQTGHYEALSLIDDPLHEYISKGYTLLPGKQFLRSVKIPNLTAPPRLTAEDAPSQQLRIERECEVLNREGSPSLTAWVNFTNVLRAYGICPIPFTGMIKISGRESLLPVHRGWILLLGLADRYGYRGDYGLFEGESSDPEWSDLGWDALYGLSGILQAIRPMRSRITFRMHSIGHMVKIPSNMPADDMSLRTLFFLFLGYIPAADGSLLCTALESDEMSSSRKTRFVPYSLATRTGFFYRLRTLEPNEIPLRHRRIANEMGIRLPRIRQADIHRIYRIERGQFVLGSSREDHGELDGVQYQRIDRTATNIKVWMDPSDSKAMVLSLLQLEMSAQSFLCDDDLAEFFARLLPTRDDYLQHLADEGTSILQIKEQESNSLEIAISEVLKYKTSLTRSRGRASALAVLEGLVKRLHEAYQIPTWATQTMAILYLMDKNFTARLQCGSNHVDPQSMFVININSKMVHVPALSVYPEAQFTFDFAAVFKVPIGEDGPTDTSLPLWQVMLAALYADIKWQMWSTAFSAWDLSRFYTDLERIVYIPGQSSLDDQDTLGGHMRDVASACREITGLLRDLRDDQARSKRRRSSRRPRHAIDEEKVESSSDLLSDEETKGEKEGDRYSETSSALSTGKSSEFKTRQRSQDLDYEWTGGSQRQDPPLTYDPIPLEELHPRPQTTTGRAASLDHSANTIAVTASHDLQSSRAKSALSLLPPPPALAEGDPEMYLLGFQNQLPTSGADPERATGIQDHGEIEKHNLIAAKCLELLSAPGILVQNACHLASPGSARIEIDSHDVAVALPPHVQYACRSWVYHLGHGSCTVKDEDQVTLFLKSHLLHWLEALALMGCMYESIAMMKTLLSLVDPSSLYVSALLADVLRFVQRIASVANTAPLQLYSSIIWLPESSPTRRIYLPQVSGSLQQLPTVEAQWSGVRQTLAETGGWQSSRVASLAFSPDGKLFASGYESGTIKLWDTATGQLLKTIVGDHDDGIEAVAFSPDSRFLASATVGGNLRGGVIQVHEPETGKKQYDLMLSTFSLSYPRAVAFNGDGTVLAAGGGTGIVTLWDLTSGSLTRSLDGHTEAVTVLSFSAGGLLASGSDDKTANLWNPKSGQVLRTFGGFSAPVCMVGFAADGNLRMGTADGVVRAWNMRDGGSIQTLTTSTGNMFWNRICRVVLSSSGKLLAVPSNRHIELHDALSGERTKIIHFVSGVLSKVTVALSPDDTLMAVGSSDQGGIEIRELCRERVIDLPSGSTATSYQTDQQIKFSPNGKVLVSTGCEGLCLWDTATGSKIHSFESDYVCEALFSPDSKWLIFSSSLRTYKWDIHRGPSGIHPFPSNGGSSLHVTISPDSKVLAQEISATGHVQLLSIETLEPLHSFQVLDSVSDMSFSPDNKSFACGLGSSGLIQRWDIETEMPLPTLSDRSSIITHVAFSSDSRLLASSSVHGKITIWDWATGSSVRTLFAHTRVAELSFCNEDAFLQIDQEVFPVNDDDISASATSPPKTRPRFGLSLDGLWITRNKSNFLWLMGYRALAVACYESRVAVTLGTGLVVFIGF